MDILELLAFLIPNKASDLHLSTGVAPYARIDGELLQLPFPPINEDKLREICFSIMGEGEKSVFNQQKAVDFSWHLKPFRLRANLFQQERGLSLALRILTNNIPDFHDLNLPITAEELSTFKSGLILIAGATGSGKSTTLASFINYLNTHHNLHIITIEDPIEFIYESKNCLIQQKEIGKTAFSYEEALKSILREDPDLILIGELRSLETIRLALTAAETGHIVLASIHSVSAAKTVNRIIDVFPGEEKPMIRSLLAESLQVVIAQKLYKKHGGGRILGAETMICTPAIRSLIRENKIAQIYSAIQTGKQWKMQTLEQHEEFLLAEGSIIN